MAGCVQGVGLALVAVSACPTVAAERRVEFAIAAQPLESALVEFSRQSGELIIVDPALAWGLRAPQVKGAMAPQRALERLLRGSGLRGVERSGGGFLVQRALRNRPPRQVQAAPTRTVRAVVRQSEPEAQSQAQPELPEILVTARRREESLADVPLAMSVLEKDRLERMRVQSAADLARLVPGVDLRDSASNKDRSILIRGVGTVSTSPGVEPSISIVVDDVLLSRPGQATIDLGDIERVEVIKGPQVTLFGKNASAGVLNIVTSAPSDQAEALVRAELASDREQRVAARLSGPIGTTPLRYALSGLVKRYAGNQINLASGRLVNGMDREGFRAKLQTGSATTVEATLSFDYLNTRENVPNGTFTSVARSGGGTGGQLVYSPLLAAILAEGGIVPSRFNTNIRTDTDSRVADENYGGSVRIEAALGTGFRLTSITAFRRWDNVQVQDYDGVDRLRALAVPGAQIGGDDEGLVRTRQFSQELRLTGDSPLGDLIAGLYFLDVDTKEFYRRRVRLPVGSLAEPYEGNAAFTVNSQNLAAFGEVHVGVSEQVKLLAGIRVLYDQLAYDHSRRSNAPPGGVPGIRPDVSSSGRTGRADWAGRIGLQFITSPHNSVYATLSRGYKGPAYSVSFNMPAAAASPLAPETSLAWEAGAKGMAAGGRITYDLALFWTDFSGFQTNYPVSFLGINSTRLINAGTIRSRGIELDARFRPSDRLALQIAAAFLDAKVRRFNCPSGAICPSVDGGRLPYSPKFKVSLDGSYRLPLGSDAALEFGANGTFRSATAFQLHNSTQTSQPAYFIADAYALFEPNNRTVIKFSVNNILNKKYSTYISEGNVSGTIHYLPRNYERYASAVISIKI